MQKGRERQRKRQTVIKIISARPVTERQRYREGYNETKRDTDIHRESIRGGRGIPILFMLCPLSITNHF